jgi:hypothetical protein
MTADSPVWQILLRCTAPRSAEQNDLLIFLGEQPARRARGLTVKLMRPRSRGVQRLADPNPHRQPDIRLNLAADPEDERRLVEGVRLLLAMANTADLAQHSGVVVLDGRELLPAEAVAAMRETHTAPTRRIGPGDVSLADDTTSTGYGARVIPGLRRTGRRGIDHSGPRIPPQMDLQRPSACAA